MKVRRRIILEMTVSVTEFRARCLEIIREAERERKVVEITRRGVVVARLLPAEADPRVNARPWERLRGSGMLFGPPEQSVLIPPDEEPAEQGLGAVTGWLPDDDPFLSAVDEIVTARARHRPLSHKR